LVEGFYKDNMTMNDPAAPPEIVTAGYARKAHILYEYLHRMEFTTSQKTCQKFCDLFSEFFKEVGNAGGRFARRNLLLRWGLVFGPEPQRPIDVTVPEALQVSEKGDLANCRHNSPGCFFEKTDDYLIICKHFVLCLPNRHRYD